MKRTLLFSSRPRGRMSHVAKRSSGGIEGIFRLAVASAMDIEWPVVFWGCGGQAVVLRDILSRRGGTLVHVVSDAGERGFDGIPVSTWQAFVSGEGSERQGSLGFAVAIGGERGGFRLDRIDRMKAFGLEPLTLVHPSAELLSGSSYGQACQILARSVVGVSVQLGDGVIVNTGAIVDHETVVGNGCHLAPGSILLGRVTLGDRVFVGANATVLPNRSVCDDVIIAAGAVVTADIESPGTYVGAPARRLPIR